MSDRSNDRPQAQAIARGLISTGKAKAPQDFWAGGYIKMFAGNAVHFWVRDDGQAIYRVVDDGATEEEMPAAFLDEMAAAGASPEGQAIELKARMPSPQDDPSIYDAYDTPYRPPGWVNPAMVNPPDDLRQELEQADAKCRAGKLPTGR